MLTPNNSGTALTLQASKTSSHVFVPQLAADGNRRERRALVKALGHRQFKKLYRKAPT